MICLAWRGWSASVSCLPGDPCLSTWLEFRWQGPFKSLPLKA